MNESEQPLPIKTIVFALFILLFVFLSMLQSIGCLPEKTNYSPDQTEHDRNKLQNDEEKLIYGLLIMDGFDEDESRKAVINTRD